MPGWYHSLHPFGRTKYSTFVLQLQFFSHTVCGWLSKYRNYLYILNLCRYLSKSVRLSNLFSAGAIVHITQGSHYWWDCLSYSVLWNITIQVLSYPMARFRHNLTYDKIIIYYGLWCHQNILCFMTRLKYIRHITRLSYTLSHGKIAIHFVIW